MKAGFPKILVLIAVIQIIAGEVYAQKFTDTLSIQEISVRAVKPLQNSSLTVTRLDSLMLKTKTSNTLSELLAEHSGIFIKTYGRGALSTASFRGTDPSHTKVLWNGIELNSPMLGMVDFSQVPMFFIDKAELLHGTSSLSESSGALGGIINLSTQADWNNRFSGSVTQGAGSYHSHDEHIRIDMGNSKIQSQTRIFYAHSDNDFSFENKDIIDSINLETGKQFHPEMINEDAWFSNYGILEELHYRLSKNDFLNFSFWGQESSRSIPLLSTREGSPVKNRQNENSVRSFLSYSHYGDKLNLKFFSGLSYVDQRFFEKISQTGSPVQMRSDSKNQTSSLFNKLDLQYQLSDGLRMDFSFGADFHQVESFERITLQGYTKSRVHSYASGSLYKNWNKRWTSTLKARADMISDSKAIPVFFAGSEYHILSDNRFYIKMILASNAKFPSLNDLYYQPWGNSNLKPERSMDQEFGTCYKFSRGNFELTHDFTFYMSQVSDWIMWKYVTKGFSPENIEKVDIKGIENTVSLAYKSAGTTVKLSSGYALTHSRDMEQNLNGFDLSYGKQLPYIPVHSANAMLYFMRNNWSLTYIWNYYSERNTTSSNQNSAQGDYLEPYFMNQIGFGKMVHLGRLNLDMNMKVHNLFDESYMSILQRPMPGRNYSFQLRLNF
jgi:iron complex outermembrane receptor protein